MKSPMPDALPQLVPYVLVNNVAAATEKAKSFGATVLAGGYRSSRHGKLQYARRSDRRGLCALGAENARIESRGVFRLILDTDSFRSLLFLDAVLQLR